MVTARMRVGAVPSLAPSAAPAAAAATMAGPPLAWTGAPGVVHSAAAKAGVLALTRTLAVEWARHKIRVNAIAPGPVHTEGATEHLFPDATIEEGIRRTIPLRRFATLEEIANAACYLLSDYAPYVTGEAFVIDGGQWLSGADYWGRIKQMMT